MFTYAGYRVSAEGLAVWPSRRWRYRWSELAAITTVLRVDNQHDSDMRVFAVMGGQEHYLGAVNARRTREFALDPSWLGMTDVSITSRQADNSDALTRGPFRLERGRMIDFVIPKGAIDESKRPIPVPAP